MKDRGWITRGRLVLCVLSVVMWGCTDKPLAEEGDDAEPVPEKTFYAVRDRAAPEGGSGDGQVLMAEILRWGELSPSEVRFSAVPLAGSEDGLHFEAIVDAVVRFEAGQRTAAVPVKLIGNDTDEASRFIGLVLSNPSPGGRLVRSAALGVIANDDQACVAPPSANPWLQRRPIGFAHRGGVFEFPENTLFAYREAAALGLEVLELDVYITADGEIVVLHDDTVDRTTNGSGRVADLTLAELRALDAAYWFVPGQGAVRDAPDEAYVFRGVATGDRPPPEGYRAEDFQIPTLEEALQALPRHWLNVELKPSPQMTGVYEQRVAELLLQYGRNTDVMVASFVDSSSSLFKAAAPCISTAVPTAQVAAAVLAGQGPLPGLPLGVLHQAFQVPASLLLPVVTPDFISDAHANGLAVHVFTINDCEEMKALLDLGVDGIMTDRPATLAALLRQPPDNRDCQGLP